MVRLAPWLWLVMVAAASTRMVVRRRAPADAPLWPAVAAGSACAALSSVWVASVAVQAAIAALVTTALAGLFLHWRRLLHEDGLPPGVGGNRLVDLLGEVVDEIPATPDADATAGEGGFGQVALGGDTWRAVTAHGGAMDVGKAIRVVAVRGTSLVVTAADERGQRGSPSSGDDGVATEAPPVSDERDVGRSLATRTGEPTGPVMLNHPVPDHPVPDHPTTGAS